MAANANKITERIAKVQIAFVVLLGAHLISYGLTGGLTLGYFLIFMAVTAIFIGGIIMFLKLLRVNKGTQKFVGELESAKNNIFSMTIEEAKLKAEKLLEDVNKFTCSPGKMITEELFCILPQTVNDLFAKCADLKAVAGEAHLSVEDIGPSKYHHGFIRIGTDSDFVELVVEANKDPVYEVDGTESLEDLQENSFPSVYHWVLFVNFVLYDISETDI